jgi:hypothetical protein
MLKKTDATTSNFIVVLDAIMFACIQGVIKSYLGSNQHLYW